MIQFEATILPFVARFCSKLIADAAGLVVRVVLVESGDLHLFAGPGPVAVWHQTPPPDRSWPALAPLLSKQPGSFTF